MKKIIIDKNVKEVFLSELDQTCPIFAKKNDKFTGMIINESNGWILRFCNGLGSSGHYETLRKCLTEGTIYGYTFFVDI